MTGQPIPLGAFDLLKPVGRGAAGEVWHAVHRRQGLPVAVKVVTAEHARRQDVRAAFHNEVRNVAKLNHPGIVMVLDYGELPQLTAEQTGGHLVPGSPFFVMEYASGGTLPRRSRPMEWGRLRALLLELLDALAHAHARGVVHRDIKPANVLISTHSDGRPGLKLTDFGIARALGAAVSPEGMVSGTPHYMAPEQILDDPRNQGPWTDLYSLGCLAYQFATGRRMYRGDANAVIRAQVNEDPPRLNGTGPKLDLPTGFQGWLDRMLAKRATDRYPLAADAAWGLACLRGARGGAATGGVKSSTEANRASVAESHATHHEPSVAGKATGQAAHAGSSGGSGSTHGAEVPGKVVGELSGEMSADLLDDGDTIQVDPQDVLSSNSLAGIPALTTEDGPDAGKELATLADIFSSRWDQLAVQEANALKGQGGKLEIRAIHRPPIPPTWDRGDEARGGDGNVTLSLVDAGLGLYGLRTVPLVDRHEERDLVWQALRDVESGGTAQAIIFQGGAGYGKTRLVEWLSQRAHEVGGASVLRASHSPIAGPSDGLGAMIGRQIGSIGLEGDVLEQRAGRFVEQHPLPGDGPEEARILSSVIAGHRAERAIRFSSPEERHNVIVRFVQRLCRRRPVILWLDDVQWGADALAFCRHLLEDEKGRRLPVLALATVRDDVLDVRPSEAAWLDTLHDLSSVSACYIGPLEPTDQRELVTELLHLEGSLAKQVVERTAGNPLFAVQLVGDWVERGVLEVGSHGFQLATDEEAALPDDIHSLWTGRLQQLFRHRSDSDGVMEALEVAAALGREVHWQEWQIACSLVGVRAPDDAIETLLSHRLLERTRNGLAFAHGMLQESLARTAREGRRNRRHHLACADMLGRAYPGDHPQIAERRGEHLLEAGELGAAMQPLFRGALGRLEEGEYRRAIELFERRDEAMKALGVSASDPRWGEGWIRWSKVLLMKGDIDEANILCRQAREAAREHHWARIGAMAASQEGFIRLSEGRTADAVTAYERALAAFDGVDDPAEHADALQGLGAVHFFRHETDKAKQELEQAIAMHREAHDQKGEAKALRLLANVYIRNEMMQAAMECIQRALSVFEAAGHRYDVASCYNDLGEAWRITGNLEQAEWFYRKAAEGYASVGTADVSTPRFNLALVLLMRERFQDAETVLNEELARMDSLAGESLDVIWLHAGKLPCLAARDDWTSYRAVLNALTVELAESEIVDEDIPLCAAQGANIAERAGKGELAVQTWKLVEQQHRGMGNEEKADRIAVHVSRVSG